MDTLKKFDKEGKLSHQYEKDVQGDVTPLLRQLKFACENPSDSIRNTYFDDYEKKLWLYGGTTTFILYMTPITYI